jgi:YidC/Oxa1 family membrane protein insertase
MNFRELIFPIMLSALCVWAINSFFTQNNSEHTGARAGQQLKVLPSPEAARPLLLDTRLEKSCTPQQQEITIGTASIIIDEDTAAISALRTSRSRGNSTVLIPIIESDIPSHAAFLLAFDESAPCTFKLIDRQDNNDRCTLTFESNSIAHRITKKIAIIPAQGIIEIALAIDPGNNPLTPRIIVPAPHDTLRSPSRGVLLDDQNHITLISAKKVSDSFWLKPTIFGGDTYHALTALIGDSNEFARRGYYSVGKDGKLTAVIEGPQITDAREWHLRFFCGPKELELLTAADVRLEETLEYGWLGWLVKFLLKLLTILYEAVGNYGWSIIILTICLQLMLTPGMLLSNGSDHARSRGEYERKTRYLEQRYKDDPHTLAQEKLALMRKMAPSTYASMAGCLLILGQIPIFFALNRLLGTSVDLYGAPFIGWIHDLSIPDQYYILPILIAAASLWRGMSTATEARMGILIFIFSIGLGAAATNFAAGLSLYLLSAASIGALQMWIIARLRARR